MTQASASVMLEALNPRQREAVTYLNGPLLVLAGAGSGKTRVITGKIAWLVQNGVAPHEIAALTFTNKAAREMRTRASRLLQQRTRGLNVCTFHSLGLNFLRREATQAGLRGRFSVLAPAEAQVLLRDLHRATNSEIELAHAAISRWKSALVSPEEVAGERPYGALYARYDRHLRACNAVDFDDLIALPVRLLQADPSLAERWQRRLRYLLVDEYQDTNAAQYKFFQLLAGVRGAFTVVGDDDQSIYAWRGARPENLIALSDDFPPLKVIKLEQNYRSTAKILTVANHLISNNPHLYSKRLWSALGEGESIRVLTGRDEHHEAERIASEILNLKQRFRVEFGNVGILYRGNHQARVLERALRQLRIPYQVSGAISWFDRTEIRDVVAYLRLLANPDDDAAFLRIVNVPRREVGAATLEGLADYAKDRECSLFSACFEFGLKSRIAARSSAALAKFAKIVSQFAERAEREPPAELARELLSTIGYFDWLDDSASSPGSGVKRRAYLDEFLDWMARWDGSANEGGLAERLQQLSLMEMLDRGESDSTDTVRLMTLHAAKGLEFDVVFIAGFEETLLPHRESIEADRIEEERRLAYVGLTRARRRLYLSHVEKRRRFGEIVVCEPSRFLQELPTQHLVFEGSQERTAEEKTAVGQAHLAAMRAMLSRKS